MRRFSKHTAWLSRPWAGKLACVCMMLALAAAGAPAPASASSPDAWAALFAKAEAACKAASGLAETKMVGKPVDFEAHVLVRITGRWPQPHMKGAPPATFACLYAKAGGTAEAHEMDPA